jgi:hypothetical protein
MIKWEYARLESRAGGINVVFTHRPAWTGLPGDAFFDTLRRLGDEGWELVTALPLGAETSATVPPPVSAGAGERDRPVAGYGPREPARESPPPSQPQTTSFQVSTDRWLILKRPQPEPPPSQASQQTDIIKDLVGKHVLKGRLPLP